MPTRGKIRIWGESVSRERMRAVEKVSDSSRKKPGLAFGKTDRKINDELGTPSGRVWGGDQWITLQTKQNTSLCATHNPASQTSRMSTVDT